MSLGIIGIDPTSVTTSPGFALGARGAVEDQTTGSGTKEYIYVAFPASQAVAIGNALAINSLTGVATVLTSTNGAAGQTVGRRVGVAPAVVASSTAVQYGWLQVYGQALMQATAAQAVNTALTTTAVGGVLGAGGVAVTGIVNTAVGAGTTPVSGTLNYPFVTG